MSVYRRIGGLLGAILGLLPNAAPAAQTRKPDRRILPTSVFRDRLRGGWAGQMIGVSYGSVYEFQALGQPITTPLREWKPEYIANSIHQDDIYVEMTFLKTLETYGLAVTPAQAGRDFRDSQYPLWHANDAGRRNLRDGILPPQSGHPRYNPHADDIDFQIEADLFGLIAPGMPRAAGRLCDLFGSIMNYGDGLYGGRFVAAMYCQAYLEKGPSPDAVRRCVEAGLAAIPAKSAYARTIRDVLAGFRRYPDDWLQTWRTIQEKWGEDDLCPDGFQRPFNIDAKLNGAYIAIGLLYGRGDFAKTLEITTRCGQDADCNPSNAAGVLGTLYGYSRIPAIYTSGIPALTGHKFAFTDYDYPGLVAACERVARRLLLQNGGRILQKSGETVMEIPLQRPQPPKTLEQMRFFTMEEIQRWRAEADRRRARQLFAGGWNGWEITACGSDMDPGIRAVLGRSKALVTHPVDSATPAVLQRRVTLPTQNPRLLLTVASHPDPADADWELRVLVDGQTVERRIIHSPGVWQEILIDLSPFAGKQVLLRLENAAGGGRLWAWEAGYWARAEVRGE